MSNFHFLCRNSKFSRTKDFPYNTDPDQSGKIQNLDKHLTHRSPKVAPNTERSPEDFL